MSFETVSNIVDSANSASDICKALRKMGVKYKCKRDIFSCKFMIQFISGKYDYELCHGIHSNDKTTIFRFPVLQ